MVSMVKDPLQAIMLWEDSKIFGVKRTPTGPFDFGDVATVGKHLKRIGVDFSAAGMERDFGYYLGQHEGLGLVVAIKGLSSPLIGYEAYPTLDELKQHWQLD